MTDLLADMEWNDTVKIAILSVLQGIAEFLPISSSGHIVTFGSIMESLGPEPKKRLDITELNIVLHAGTLLSILLYYHRAILQILLKSRRLIPLICIGTLPVVVSGLSIKYSSYAWIDKDPLLAGFMFVVTGFLLMTLPRLGEGTTEYTEINWRQALLIGLFQAVAILPGISRSGSTIVGGCLLGLKRESAATFSFLLAIPAILGAVTLECRDLLKEGSSTSPVLLAFGFVLSFVVGLISLVLLVRWLGKGKLHLFAYYVILLGFAVVSWQIYELIGDTPPLQPPAQ